MSGRRGQACAQGARDRALAAKGSTPGRVERLDVSASYVVKARQRRASTGCATLLRAASVSGRN
jgi:hypothetical protein